MARRLIPAALTAAAVAASIATAASPAAAIPSGSNTPFTATGTCTIETGPVTFRVSGYDYAGKTYVATLEYRFDGEARPDGASYTDNIAGYGFRTTRGVDTPGRYVDNVGRVVYDVHPVTGMRAKRQVRFSANTTDASVTACAVFVALPNPR